MSLQTTKFSKKIVAVVEPHLTPFLLTLGIDEVYEVKGGEDFVKNVKEICSRDDVAIIVTQRSLTRKYGEIQDQMKVYPIIVSLPDSPEDLGAEAINVYKEFIKRFIGYEIHIGV